MINKAHNFHATALRITIANAQIGVLITGASGSGKSRLALQILREKSMDWDRVDLISDDQVFLNNKNGKLIATTPPQIAGKIELRGFGVLENQPHATKTPIQLVAELVEKEEIERMPEKGFTSLMDCSVRHIKLPMNDFYHALLILNYNLHKF